jgi:hypothetical protein
VNELREVLLPAAVGACVRCADAIARRAEWSQPPSTECELVDEHRDHARRFASSVEGWPLLWRVTDQGSIVPAGTVLGLKSTSHQYFVAECPACPDRTDIVHWLLELEESNGPRFFVTSSSADWSFDALPDWATMQRQLYPTCLEPVEPGATRELAT